MIPPRIYIDTSVFGGKFDEEFKADTDVFFQQIENGLFRVLVSTVTVQEILPAPDNVRNFFSMIKKNEILANTDEAIELQNEYYAKRILGESSYNDGLHIALATIARVDYIVSWNFKHFVNVNKIRAFNAVNLSCGYNLIDIRTPREVLFDED